MSVNGYFVTKNASLETLLCGYILHLIHYKNILAWVFVMDLMLIHLFVIVWLDFSLLGSFMIVPSNLPNI